MGAHIDPLRAVAQLQDVVHTLAPTLRPQVLPAGAAYGLDLVLGLCRTTAQKQELRALVHAAKPKASSNDDDELEVQAVGSFDVDKKVFNIEKIVWMTQQDAVVHEFARFLELQLDSPDEAAPIVAHFHKVNGHASDNTRAAEQCFNAAFALQTILRAFPRLPIAIDGGVVEIDDASDIANVFAPLLRGSKKKTKKKQTQQQQSAGSSETSSKSKSKKRTASS